MAQRLAAVILLLALAAGCKDNGPASGAARVLVRYPDFVPGCLRITVTDPSAADRQVQHTYGRDVLPAGEPFVAAVYRKKDWAASLDVRVESFERVCEGTAVEVHATGAPLDVGSGIRTFEVALTAVDQDGDGFAARTPEHPGASDCDDARSEAHPGATEICTSAKDTDCDGLAACDDSDCQAQACDDGDACTSLDVCGAGGCQGTPRACDLPPPGGCHQASGACVEGECRYAPRDIGSACTGGPDAGPGVCSSQALCVSPDVEFDCTDGEDDDGDGKVDCADSEDCQVSFSCDDGNACTVGDLCQQDATCRGSQMDCGAPTQCATPTCVDGACVPMARTGAPCADMLACTANDACGADGVCRGTAQCGAPGPCQKAGMCTAQGCTFEADVGAACNDGNAQTAGDACRADETCAGTPYTCPPPSSSCLTGPVYEGDGTCSYPLDPAGTCMVGGQPGICKADGTCANTAGWPYVPSNFLPSAITAPTTNVTLSCEVLFDSTSKGFSPQSCPFPATLSDVTLPDGRLARVLAVQNLTVTATGRLHVVTTDTKNAPPVILAVFGSADIAGSILAHSSRGQFVLPGAGTFEQDCGPRAGGAGVFAGKGGGGGGGGFSASGAPGGGSTSVNAAGGQAGAAEAPATALPLPLRGGCVGGTGGRPDKQGSLGGAGGGALQVSVKGTLKLSGTVSASGMGGAPADDETSGGGGGGSGGTVILEGAGIEVSSTARLTSNGGGGGGGNKNGSIAGPGADGSTTLPVQAPGGSASTGSAGNGGAGGSVLGAAQGGITSIDGGGGGGGGTGFIYVRHHGAASACVFAPMVQSPAAIRMNCP